MSFQQTIYNRLRYHGISQAGALGILGNFDCESNCEPYRLQGDFSPYRTNSHIYVQNVTNGTISQSAFAHDQKGFGIYQLTYHTRKDGYWSFWKASGKALDDAELQVDYAIKEMKESYPQLLAFLKTTDDIFTACSRVCREFERPAVNNIDARYASAKRIQHEIDLDAWQGGGADPEPQPTPTPQPVVDHSLKLRVIDKNCESFTEFELLKLLLKLRNYDTVNVWDATRQFQKDQGLVSDGVVGNKTWVALLSV